METTAREGQPAQKKGESTGPWCVQGGVGVGVQDYEAQDTLPPPNASTKWWHEPGTKSRNLTKILK